MNRRTLFKLAAILPFVSKASTSKTIESFGIYGTEHKLPIISERVTATECIDSYNSIGYKIGASLREKMDKEIMKALSKPLKHLSLK